MDRANGDVMPSRRRLRLPRPRWWVVAVAVVAGSLLTAAGAAAYATHNFARDHEGRLLPGTSIEGLDLSGMTRRAALRAVRAQIKPDLDREITVTQGRRSWTVTPRRLGTTTDAEELVDAALEASRSASSFDLMRIRLLGDDLGFSDDVTLSHERRRVRRYVRSLSAKVDREPRDASVDYSTGWIEIVRERPGRYVKKKAGVRAVMSALEEGKPKTGLPVRAVAPEVTTDAFRQVLLLRIGENRLYYYENGEVEHSWVVATGQPEYPTPTGLFHVELKRYMPTWINPAPDGWGASMPKTIGPGRSNPLGTRALNWTAPGIRFHGTTATHSLGYNASHGCVRLSMPDVELLYDLVEVGTPIVSINAGSYSPLYDDSAPATEGA